MYALVKDFVNKDSFNKATVLSLVFGLVTTVIALLAFKSGNADITMAANFLGGAGNDAFLLCSNILIIGYAMRKRLQGVLRLTLLLDLWVWILVQGAKLIKIEPWHLRPSGAEGGFPSGHATHAFAMAFFLTYFFPRFYWLWYSIAAAISWSRIETDCHNGFQVTVGIMLGIGIAFALLRRWCKRTETAVVRETNIKPVQALQPQE